MIFVRIKDIFEFSKFRLIPHFTKLITKSKFCLTNILNIANFVGSRYVDIVLHRQSLVDKAFENKIAILAADFAEAQAKPNVEEFCATLREGKTEGTQWISHQSPLTVAASDSEAKLIELDVLAQREEQFEASPFYFPWQIFSAAQDMHFEATQVLRIFLQNFGDESQF